ncbi:Crp/Fnr family transcriptional regulator [Hyphococcus sp. DH-69]|uniref:Crp/Fnr family transcriptional regulator n=1 Tax=Hyphococcus formosus TaxID=3143534 RepID=UPI00398BAF74
MSAILAEPVAAEFDVVEKLSRIPPFHDLPTAVLELLRDQSERRHYDAGQTVFSLGQYDGGEFVVVLNGGLRVSVADPIGGGMMIEDVLPQGVFGLEIAIAEPDQALFQTISVTAEEQTDLIVIDAAEFSSLAAGRPSLMRNIASYLAENLVAKRFGAMATQIADEQRIYATLLECVERDVLTGIWRIEKMPKHREIADIAKVDETVAAGAVASLIQDGVAERDYPGLIIKDISRLNTLAR